MSVERDILVSVLRLTVRGKARIEDISRNAGTIIQVTFNILKKYSKMRFFRLEDDSVIMEKGRRIKLAVHLVELGADLERVSDLLNWAEFEDISSEALEANGFSVIKHFRFKWSKRRWEIDILGFKNPVVVAVDCKHWHRGWRRSAIMRIVELQIKRTHALAEASAFLREKMNTLNWKRAVFVPVVLSLFPGPLKFHMNTPIVPVLQIRNFLNEMTAYSNSLTHFTKDFRSSNT